MPSLRLCSPRLQKRQTKNSFIKKVHSKSTLKKISGDKDVGVFKKTRPGFARVVWLDL